MPADPRPWRRVALCLSRARGRHSLSPVYVLRLDVEGEDGPVLVDAIRSPSLAAALRHLSSTAPRILMQAAAEVECGATPDRILARKELTRAR
jgi:hypothetical protein